jgi:hypothetical protein
MRRIAITGAKLMQACAGVNLSRARCCHAVIVPRRERGLGRGLVGQKKSAGGMKIPPAEEEGGFVQRVVTA